MESMNPEHIHTYIHTYMQMWICICLAERESGQCIFFIFISFLLLKIIFYIPAIHQVAKDDLELLWKDLSLHQCVLVLGLWTWMNVGAKDWNQSFVHGRKE